MKRILIETPKRTAQEKFNEAVALLGAFGFEPKADSRPFEDFCRIFVED
jgi:hypothetical protein